MDEITNHFQWTSVVLHGRYRELPDLPQYAEERDHARKLLETRSLWWQTAFASRRLKSADDFIPPLFYCIEIDSMTGYRAVADAGESVALPAYERHRGSCEHARGKATAPDVSTVLYSTQTVSPLVTHENTPTRDANVLILRLILLSVALVTAIGIARPQEKREQKPVAKQASVTPGKETFLRYCASCHGEDGKGDGPAAVAMKPPPSDLTTISKRHEGKYPAGYVAPC